MRKKESYWKQKFWGNIAEKEYEKFLQKIYESLRITFYEIFYKLVYIKYEKR
jgi:hypothetical protein